MPNKARKHGDEAVVEPARVIQERKKADQEVEQIWTYLKEIDRGR